MLWNLSFPFDTSAKPSTPTARSMISASTLCPEKCTAAGQNGCGKSTLIKIISGVYRPDVGAAMTLGGKTWPKLTPAASVAHGIGDLSGSVAVSQSQRVGEHCYKPLSSRRTGEAQRTATQCGAGDAQY
ncbi:ATP-binding cassette domain-containing protein [Klebsiella pneumoniae]|nr:ATP-binding cassette domain-containing protein [Klebsiella pneumoniae]